MVYGIYGDGAVTKKYLTEALGALRDRSELEKEEFWLILPYDTEGVSEALVETYSWAIEEKPPVYVRTYSNGEDEEAAADVDEFLVVRDPRKSFVKDLAKEGGELLVLLLTTDMDEPDPGDEAVNVLIEQCWANGIPVRQLNNGMMELTAETEAEPDLTSDGPADEGFTEDEVLALGVAADQGDEDATQSLSTLAEELGVDIAEEPYASMSWADFAAALIDAAGDPEEAPEAPVAAEKQPQAYDREDLERKQLRTLRNLARQEGWGDRQEFPKWFLVDHLANGTVPTEDQLSGEEVVPETPGKGPRKAAAKVAAVDEAEVDEAPRPSKGGTSQADIYREIGDRFIELGNLFKLVANRA